MRCRNLAAFDLEKTFEIQFNRESAIYAVDDTQLEFFSCVLSTLYTFQS
jgi:hypothetical protein